MFALFVAIFAADCCDDLVLLRMVNSRMRAGVQSRSHSACSRGYEMSDLGFHVFR